MEEMNAKGVVLKAFDQFRLKSCIDFKPRDSEEYYISVQKDVGYVLYFFSYICTYIVLHFSHAVSCEVNFLSGFTK